MKYIDNIRESLARILVFIMVFMQIIGNGSVIPVFAEAFTRETDQDLIASASNAIRDGKVSLRNSEQKELELMVQSESSRYESGDLMYLDVYLKNNSSESITDGILKFSGRGIIKETGYFEDFQDSSSSFGPGIELMDEKLNEEDDEFDESDEVVSTISEDGKLSNIVLKPNSLYHVGFYGTIDDIENIKSSEITFKFKGKKDSRSVSTSNSFDYTIGGMNLMPVELDNEFVENEEYTMTLAFDLGSQFEEIIEDKMLEDEVDLDEIEIESKEESTPSNTQDNIILESESSTDESEVEASISESSTDESEVAKKDNESNDESGASEDIKADIELSLEKTERNMVKSSLFDEESSLDSKEIDSSLILEDSDKSTEVEEGINKEELSEVIESEETSVESDDKNEEDIVDLGSVIDNEINVNNETNIDITNNNNVDETKNDTKNIASESNANIKKDEETPKKDNDKDENNIATPSNAYVKWDSDEINRGEKPVIKDIKCEIETFGIELYDFEVVDIDSELNTKLNVRFKVKEGQEPGIHFGKVQASYKYKNKTYKTSQGFMVDLSGEMIDLDEEITLVGYLGNTEISVTGPRRSFPIAKELELSVSEVDGNQQELVDTALDTKQEELGIGVSGLKAIDIKVLADGEYKEINGDVIVNFKNTELQEAYKSLEFTEDELDKISEVNDMEIEELDFSEYKEESVHKEVLSDSSETLESNLEVTSDTIVYHLDEEAEKLTEMSTQLTEDGDIEMVTDHFSIYIIVNFETVGIPVKVTHWATVKDFTIENGGLEDITSEEFKENHMAELDSRVERNPGVITNSDLIKVRLSELKYVSNFTNDISKYDLTEKMLNGSNNSDYPIIDKYKKVPDKLFPGKIEKDGNLEYPTVDTQIYSSNTYMLPGWATKGIPYTILLDKLSKINNTTDKNYEIDKITFITDTSEDATLNRKTIVFKKNGDSYEVESGELPNNPPIDDLSNLDEINEDDILLELGQYNEVRFDYKETTGTSDVDVAFHDYNLGEMYIDNQGYRIAEGWWDSSKYDGYNGINAPVVYKKVDGNTENVIEYSNKLGRIYIGGGEAKLGFSAFSNSEGKYATVPLNKNFNNPVVGYAKKELDTKDSYDVFTIKDPGLFYPGNLYSTYTYKDKETHLNKETGEEVEVDVKKEVEVLAKEYLPGYKIGFNRIGDTYIINNVKNPSGKEVLSDLDTLKYTGAKYWLNYPLYSNMFWPLDELGDRQNGGQDQLKPLDKNSLYQKDQSVNFSQNDEDTAENKTIRHNWLFGMNFSVEFNVKEYTGPLNYYFRGDDDLFVYVDGKLMVDIGGIHSSYGTFINVKDWLVEEGLAERNPNNSEEIIPLVDGVKDPDHKYTMNVFYTERGGTGSCCYMMYTLPKVKPVEVPIPTTLKYTFNKNWNDGGNTTLRPTSIDIQLYQNGEPYGEQMTIDSSERNEDDTKWVHVWNNLPRFDDNNNEYEYTVEEVSTNENYVQTNLVTEKSEGEEKGLVNVTLTNTSLLKDFKVTKNWVNTDESDKRQVDVALYKYITSESTNEGEEDTSEEDTSEDDEFEEDGDFKEGDFEEDSGINEDIPSDSSDDNDITDSESTSEVVNSGLILVDLSDIQDNFNSKVTLSSTNNWTYTWHNLPEYENNGDKINYIACEVELDSNGNIARMIEDGSTTSDEKFIVDYTENSNGSTITNTYNFKSLNVQKVWDNSDTDELNVRPKSITVNLNRDGEVYRNTVLSESNGYKERFSGLPIKRSNGTDYEYSVNEIYGDNTLNNDDILIIDNKYQYQVSYKNETDGFKVINTWVPLRKGNITVKKIWTGLSEDEQDKKSEITVALYRDNEKFDTVSLSEDNDWKYTWDNLELDRDLNTHYTFYVRELFNNEPLNEGREVRFDGVNKYQVRYTSKDNEFIITNNFVPIPKIDVAIEKDWNDDVGKSNDPNYIVKAGRPNYVYFQLYQDSVPYGKVVRLNVSNTEDFTKYTWKDLPRYHVINSEEVDYTYSVKEFTSENGLAIEDGLTCRFDGIHKYKVRYNNYGNDTDYNKHITNSYVPDPLKDIIITKNWLSADGKKLDESVLEGDMLEEIKVNIYRKTENDAEFIKYRSGIILNKFNNWTYTIKNVEIADLNDVQYIYKVVEVHDSIELEDGTDIRFNGVDKFEVSYSEPVLISNTETYNINNTYIAPELINITLNKEWEGEGDDYISKRPDYVLFKLFRRVEGGEKEEVKYSYVDLNGKKSDYALVKAEDGWKYVWENLKKYDNQDKEYIYSVTEYYTKYTYDIFSKQEKVSIEEMPLDEAVRLEGINRDTYIVSYGSMTNVDGGKAIKVTNTYKEPIPAVIKVEKKWVGINANEHPNTIQVIIRGTSRKDKIEKIITLDSTNNFYATESFNYYDKYGYYYTWEVKEFVDGKEVGTNRQIKIDNKKYNVTITVGDDGGDGWTIYNIYQPPEPIEVKVKKTWDDTTDILKEHLDHGKVYVRLYQNDVKIVDSIELNEDNHYTWSQSFPKYAEDENNTPYNYKFIELDKDGKELEETDTCRFNGVDEYQVHYEHSGTNNENWVIQNTFVKPERTQVSVIKNWTENELSQRPSSIQVQLYKQEGIDEDKQAVGSLIDLDENNNWSHTWDNMLVRTKDDREIEYIYTVKEMNRSQELNQGDTIRFNGTDKYQVSYDIKGYNTIITNNFIEPDKTEVKVIKNWDNDQESYRPDEVKVQLYAYEEGYIEPQKVGEQVVLNKDNGWTYTWSNLLVRTNDDREKEYTYSVKEIYDNQVLENGVRLRFDGVHKYEVNYLSSDDKYNLNITNRFIPDPTRTLELIKEWDGDTEQSRPSSLGIHLYQINEDNDRVLYKDDIELNSENNWRIELTVPAQDLQDRNYRYEIVEVYDGVELSDGTEIRFNSYDKYRVNYYKNLLDDNKLIVKNTFIPRDKVSVDVTKEWIDDSVDTRPSSITVELLRNGKRFTQDDIVTVVELNSENNWKHTWNGLYQAELRDDLNDINYNYSVVELFKDKDLNGGDIVRLNGVDKYQIAYNIDGYHLKVINKFVEPTMKKIVVDKVWNDIEDRSSETRPLSIRVNLYRDETLYDSTELDDNNNWHYEWLVEAERLDDSLWDYRIAEVLDSQDLKDGDIVKFNGTSSYKVSYNIISENNFIITNTLNKTSTPPSGGGGSNTPEPRIEKPDIVPAKSTNPVSNIQHNIKEPLIGIYNIMDDMIPLSQKNAEIDDNDIPLFGLPGTGDKQNLGKYIILCVLSVIGIIGLALKNKKDDEDK